MNARQKSWNCARFRVVWREPSPIPRRVKRSMRQAWLLRRHLLLLLAPLESPETTRRSSHQSRFRSSPSSSTHRPDASGLQTWSIRQVGTRYGSEFPTHGTGVLSRNLINKSGLPRRRPAERSTAILGRRGDRMGKACPDPAVTGEGMPMLPPRFIRRTSGPVPKPLARGQCWVLAGWYGAGLERLVGISWKRTRST
jgi:hypothetical protein